MTKPSGTRPKSHPQPQQKPSKSSASEMLTPSELKELREHKKMLIEFGRKAFRKA